MLSQPRPQGVIDCAIHNAVPAVGALFPYLPEHWREYILYSDFKGPVDTPYPLGAATSAGPDTISPTGAPPGSDLALVRAQALDAWGAAYGILTCPYAIESVHNPYAAAALASAVNDWQLEAWLALEPRLRASLVIPSQYPDLSAREIDRLGDHPGVVQVLLPVRSAAPYGNRRYHPIYEAAVRHDLAVGIHFGGASGNPPTSSGWPSYYLEEYAGMAQVFQSQLISLIVEGVFDQFPTLRVVLIASGVSWLPSLMWRLDKEWKGLRRETPWVRQRPSNYIRDHVRLTIQPLDVPPDPGALERCVTQLGSDELFLFATDYPHEHGEPSAHAILDALPAGLAPKIMADNARACYRLTA